MANRQLTRSHSNRILGGVAGGIADYTGLDSSLVRIITAFVVVFTGVGLLAYIIAWLVLPEEGKSTTGLDQIIGSFRGRSNTNNPNPDDYR